MPNPQNIYLFHGPDKESLQQEVHKWTQNFEQKFGTTNLSILKENLSLSTFLNEAQTQAFLADKRLIVVYNLYSNLDKTNQEELLTQLENTKHDNIIVMIEEANLRKNSKLIKLISQIGTVKEFTLSLESLKQKAQKQVQSHQKNISPYLLEQLIKNLDQNPFKIHQEIEKIALFSQDNEITEKDIQEASSQSEIASPFKLMDAISSKNLKQSLELLQKLHQNREDLMRLFFLIVRQFRLLIQVKYLHEKNTPKNQLAKELKIAPFALANFIKFSSNFSYFQLQKALEKLLKIDSDLKNGNLKYSNNEPQEFLFAIEQFIIGICKNQ